MSPIFEYTNYRLFLSDYYSEQKKQRPHFSHRYLAEKLGLKSTGHFSQILSGRVNISTGLIARLIQFCNLTKKESRYFELIVHYTQAKTQIEKKRYFEQISEFSKAGTKVLEPDQYEFYQKWYYSAIHDILMFHPFKGDFRDLAKKIDPAISPAEAKKAVELLKRLNFIVQGPDGTYKCNEPLVSAWGEGKDVALTSYAIEMMDRAKDALNRMPGKERNISWVGFSVSKPTYEYIQEEIRTFRKRILSIARADVQPDRAYHFNMQIFPVSKSPAESPGGGK